MANTSPEAISKISTRVTDWSQTDSEIATFLNSPTIPNPVEQSTVPKKFDFADVMGQLGPSSISAVRDMATTVDLITKINLGDVMGVMHWVGALLAPPAKITSDEAMAVMAVIQATEPDPSWQSQISWALVNLGRPVTISDVAASRGN